MTSPARPRKRAFALPGEEVFTMPGGFGPGSAAPATTTTGSTHHDVAAGSTADRSHHEDLDGFARLIAAGLTEKNRRVWCTIIVLGTGGPETVAASGKQARALETAQLRFADGPGLTAVRDHVLIHVGDTGTDPRWRAYAAATIEEGIRSVLAVPFDLAGAGPASLNIRCSRPHAFDSDQIWAVQQLLEAAGDAGREVAQLLNHQGGIGELAAATTSRALVKRAAGRLMEQNRCTEQEASHRLASAAERRGLPVRELAAELVTATLHRT